jgi:hypothetical protein
MSMPGRLQGATGRARPVTPDVNQRPPGLRRDASSAIGMISSVSPYCALADSLTPPLREGRMVERSGEIVLGIATLARLHVDVGDTVHTSSGPMLIVGSATFPTIGVVHGDHTSLGVGGVVVPEQVPGFDRNRAGAVPAALALRGE